VTRLLDVGVEPYFVNSSLRVILAQRLVRKLCAGCRERYTPSASQLPKKLKLQGDGALYRPRGCEKCSKTGYFGRTVIYEMLFINEAISRLIAGRADAGQVRSAALEAGLVTLLENGYRKVARGETSLEEVHGATLQDEA
jgi:type II secretory ATPase GspE/PulE/Tfp pilus assembly ATPase PilB-like protein